MPEEQKNIVGGEFIVKSTAPEKVFIPEEWTEEQKMIAQTCKDFVDMEVIPKIAEIDSMQHPEIMPSLLDKAGELGLLATSVPEEYGGFGMDFNSSMLVGEKVGSGFSFAVALSAHTGIGTLPILYYGNEEQKKKYIPKLATGEFKACYCLTEPGSGSDANAAKSKATLSEDGKHYILNGQKMWITNGGFADILIVFAKIDNDRNLTAFILERSWEGITMNAEEKKMGIKGSSTRQVFFNNVKVPIENLLYEREKGFRIALNILNIGRIKLSAATLGAAKDAIVNSSTYATERKQFGQSISEFGAIKHKIAEMASRVYSSEAACYRAGQNIDDAYYKMIEQGMDPSEAKLKSVEEFAIECAMMKVHGSETLDYVVDEAVQTYGGMGYSQETPVERAYRDSRINRIFEGTNEINRLLTVDMLIRKNIKGKINLIGPASEVAKELLSIPDMVESNSSEFMSEEINIVKNLKKLCLLIAGAAFKKYKEQLKSEQEILMNIADMLIQIYVSESSILRTQKSKSLGKDFDSRLLASKIYLHKAVEDITKAAKEAIFAISEGDEQRMLLIGMKRFSKIKAYNLKEARRQLADKILSEKKYIFV
ncbi:acyl-CoA dehydrogenase family protein [Aureibacter tunicatorum]|uniref:Alkylation response protein AidB-like acyl-CoA dehydrogenase n=1 Tax=Aureibacter tunicatorum TaxID=866807 RepID=A0AAE4BRX1_9BACT|nr:acyl-CoA dehydrogenase family protein [Aureibacter tunicatorum]MDR6237702.1 alkylation response protein AidB-like acyl-CoA dehydrogenase [Aureibacter tunicatorum]BDD02737.1 acyl-CoA dehydrogenase [Aureibacter tunicatorum]